MFFARKQKGQAIVIIVIALLGLIAMTALAIDTGSVFSARRHAQTAADNAALAGALHKASLDVGVIDEAGVITHATEITDANHFESDNPDVDEIVVVDGANTSGLTFVDCNGQTDALQSASDRAYYVEVRIRAHVIPFFAQVVGITRLNYCVKAYAKAEPQPPTNPAEGEAIAALNCHECRSLDMGGNAYLILEGGGLFSNSNCAHYALYVTKPENVINQSFTSVGKDPGIYAPGAPSSTIHTGATQKSCPLPDEALPNIDFCKAGYSKYYSGDFPPKHSDSNVTVSGTLTTISPGVYCIGGKFDLSSDTFGTGVTFIVMNEGMVFNANYNINLLATTDTVSPFFNLLVYAPYSNDSTFKLNGGANMTITGTIFVPGGEFSMQGDFTNSAIHSQILADMVDLTGSLNATIQYDPNQQYKYQPDPHLSLVK